MQIVVYAYLHLWMDQEGVVIPQVAVLQAKGAWCSSGRWLELRLAG